MPDVDIDFYDRTQILNKIPHIIATRILNDELVAHNTGIYAQQIPFNPVNNRSTIDYISAESRGYFKIDFLNVSIYRDIKSNQHLEQLMNKEPLWELLEQDDFTNLLFHVNGYGSILREMKPTNIQQLAAVLAMIRPGKKHLVGQSWDVVMQEIWKKTDEGYCFKHSHSISYAYVIVVQMNLIVEQLSNSSN